MIFPCSGNSAGFPLPPDLSGAEVKAFLIALSHLPGAAELTANVSKSGDTP